MMVGDSIIDRHGQVGFVERSFVKAFVDDVSLQFVVRTYGNLKRNTQDLMMQIESAGLISYPTTKIVLTEKTLNLRR